MHRDSEAEARCRHVGDALPRRRVVARAPNAVVMLAPQLVGLADATHDAVHVLNVRGGRALRRHVVGLQSFSLQRPALASLAREPHATAADRDQRLAPWRPLWPER